MANYNCPGQIVITGSVEAIESSVPDLKKLGARCVKLKVRGPFHSPYLKEAGEKLGRDLEKVTFNNLSSICFQCNRRICGRYKIH